MATHRARVGAQCRGDALDLRTLLIGIGAVGKRRHQAKRQHRALLVDVHAGLPVP
jgi:hypothetical protein